MSTFVAEPTIPNKPTYLSLTYLRCGNMSLATIIETITNVLSQDSSISFTFTNGNQWNVLYCNDKGEDFTSDICIFRDNSEYIVDVNRLSGDARIPFREMFKCINASIDPTYALTPRRDFTPLPIDPKLVPALTAEELTKSLSQIFDLLSESSEYDVCIGLRILCEISQESDSWRQNILEYGNILDIIKFTYIQSECRLLATIVLSNLVQNNACREYIIANTDTNMVHFGESLNEKLAENYFNQIFN